jgi:Flp pilus assembly pilin Flp
MPGVGTFRLPSGVAHKGEQSMTKLLIAAGIAVKSFLTRKQEGAAMAEYGLLLFVIAIVVLAGAKAVGTAALGVFNQVAGAL